MSRRRWIASLLFLALLFAIAVRRVDWRAALAVLERTALAPLAAAAIVNLASLVLHGARWSLFLRRVGVRSFTLAVRGAVVAAGLNNLLVANGGDAARVLLVARASRVPRTAVLATLALDRIFDPICFALLLLAGTFVVPLPPKLHGTRAVVALALLAAGALLVILAQAPERAASADIRGWRQHLQEFLRRAVGISTGPGLALALALSLAMWATQLATFALVARSVRLEIPVAGSLAALILTNAGLALRATPGNVGFFQFAYAVAVRPFGIDSGSAVAAALLLQLVQIIPVTIAALVLAPHMLRERASPSAPDLS